MEDKCRLAIDRYQMLSRGDRLVVGLSGGADSCAMLHYLCGLRQEYDLSIVAVHVNHMIRGEEAERDAAFAERFCRKLGVTFRLYRRDVPAIAAEKGIGLEQCGREIRYGIFQEELGDSVGKIVTAHTLSDSVETVLFHIIRGCSLTGLKGIPPVRGNIIRPLILCERSDIESYCQTHGIDYVTDSTNFSSYYTRNKIRLMILPLMREINPSVSEAIGRLSDSARFDDEYLGALADEAAQDYLKKGSASRLLACEMPVMTRALIRICVQRLDIAPEQKHVIAMTDCLHRGEGSVNLPGDNIFIYKNGFIDFVKKQDECRDTVHWNVGFLEGEIITPGGQKIISRVFDKNIVNSVFDRTGENKNKEENDKNIFKNCLDYDKINKAVFRFRREGDTFRCAGRNGTKTLKKLFNEEKIPPETRRTLPLLESDGVIAWICGIGVAEQFRVTDDTQRVLYIKMC